MTVEASVRYDAVIVGSGQGGGPLGTALVAAGRKTALIEREHIGGTCINDGCTPTKTMVASARVAYLAGRGGDYGVRTGPVTVDLDGVRRRKNEIVDSYRYGSLTQINAGGTDVIMGEACFTGPRTLDVRTLGGELLHLTADLIVLDTGTRPAEPPLEGLQSIPHLNSTSILQLGELPEHLIIVGGGYIAVEFGQMFRRFGSRVTIVQRGEQLLTREDPDVSEAIRRIFAEDGIEVILNAGARSVEPAPGGDIRLSVTAGGGERVVAGSHLLVATGRRPNVEALNLRAAGIECTEKGFVQVSDRLETTAPGVYALGEIAGSPAFTHIAYDDFRILRDNLLQGGNRTTRDRLIPYTVFIDPQLGRVGMTEGEARRKGHKVRVARMPMTRNARAGEMGETRGFVKGLVDGDTDQILGVAVLGIEGGELMAMFEVAMMGKLPYTALRDGIFAHPTLAETVNTLWDGLE